MLKVRKENYWLELMIYAFLFQFHALFHINILAFIYFSLHIKMQSYKNIFFLNW